MGPRPIDLHLKAMRKLGVSVCDSHGFLECQTPFLHGDAVYLDFPSVGATENIMLAAVKADGFTTIYNAAREPEVFDLQCFLNKMGARVSGAGSSIISIEGVPKLQGAEYRIMPDRIVAATYLSVACMTNGNVRLYNLPNANAFESVLSVLQEMDCHAVRNDTSLAIQVCGRLKPIDILRTMPFPGFPTDAQAPIFSLLTVADGTSTILENIFENRFRHADELSRMGADVVVNGRMAVVRGVKRLFGAQVTCPDLRGAAALLIAALGAEGDSVLDDIYHLDRGYENIDGNLAALGAKIKRVD